MDILYFFSHVMMYGISWVSNVNSALAPNPLLLINGLNHPPPKGKPSIASKHVEGEDFLPPGCKAGSYYLAGRPQTPQTQRGLPSPSDLQKPRHSVTNQIPFLPHSPFHIGTRLVCLPHLECALTTTVVLSPTLFPAANTHGLNQLWINELPTELELTILRVSHQ